MNYCFKRFLHCGTIIGISTLLSSTAFALQPPPPPSVSVMQGDLTNADLGTPESCDVSASVANPPQPTAEHTLVPHWTWGIGDAEYSDSGQDGTFGPVTDGSTFSASGSADDTQSTATFTGTFNSDGYYEVQVSATVKYVDPQDSTRN